MPRTDHAIAGIAYHSSQEILAHPRFVAARTEFVDAMLALYEGDAFLTRLLLEAGRSVTFGVILCLDAAYEQADRATWPTMGLVKKQTALFKLSSARRIEDQVARLSCSGFLEQVCHRQDGRVRLLTPTGKMLATDRDWLAVQYLPLQVLFPDPGYAPAMQRDASFQRTQRLVAAGFSSRGAEMLAGNPAMMLFLTRDAGVMILIKLVQMAGATEECRLEVSHQDVGARFGVSRTHVGNVLQDAERAGLVALSGPGRRFVELKPAVWRAFDRFVAESMSGHDLLFRIALRQMRSARTQLPNVSADQPRGAIHGFQHASQSHA